MAAKTTAPTIDPTTGPTTLRLLDAEETDGMALDAAGVEVLVPLLRITGSMTCVIGANVPTERVAGYVKQATFGSVEDCVGTWLAIWIVKSVTNVVNTFSVVTPVRTSVVYARQSVSENTGGATEVMFLKYRTYSRPFPTTPQNTPPHKNRR